MKIIEITEATMPPERELGETIPAWFQFLRQYPDALAYLGLTPNSSEDEVFDITLDDLDQAIKQAQMDGNMDWAENLFGAFDLMYNKDNKAGF